MSAEESKEPMIVVPRLCRSHEHDLVVHQLEMSPDEPWQSAVVLASILLFQWLTMDPRFVARTQGDAEAFSLVLAEIGCSACFVPDGYTRTVQLMQRGFSHAAAVSQGKATDPDWPIDLTVKP